MFFSTNPNLAMVDDSCEVPQVVFHCVLPDEFLTIYPNILFESATQVGMGGAHGDMI